MTTTLRHLRQKSAEAFKEARQATMAPFFGGKSWIPSDYNMRQSWQYVSGRFGSFILDQDYMKTIDHRLIRFYHASQLYYYAKEHGLQAAMLWRLQNA